MLEFSRGTVERFIPRIAVKWRGEASVFLKLGLDQKKTLRISLLYYPSFVPMRIG